MSSGFVIVFENQVFEGSVAGGAVPTSWVRELWRVVKSEYRFGTVYERSGRRIVMLYCVKGGLVEDVVAEGMEISGREPIFAIFFALN